MRNIKQNLHSHPGLQGLQDGRIRDGRGTDSRNPQGQYKLQLMNTLSPGHSPLTLKTTKGRDIIIHFTDKETKAQEV